MPIARRLERALRECASARSLGPVCARLRSRKDRASAVPPWVRPEFAVRARLAERIGAAQSDTGSRSPQSAECRSLLNAGFPAHVQSLIDRSAARFQCELRHPFFDARLVEFAMALPADQLCRGGEIKSQRPDILAGLPAAPGDGAFWRRGGQSSLSPVCRCLSQGCPLTI